MEQTTILRLPEVQARTGLSKSTIYAKIANGKFPIGVELGPRSVGWRAHEIETWIAERPRRTRVPGVAA